MLLSFAECWVYDNPADNRKHNAGLGISESGYTAESAIVNNELDLESVAGLSNSS